VALSPRVKRVEHEADYSPPSRMAKIYLHSSIILHGVVLN
jgi:hypothetical protein